MIFLASGKSQGQLRLKTLYYTPTAKLYLLNVESVQGVSLGYVSSKVEVL